MQYVGVIIFIAIILYGIIAIYIKDRNDEERTYRDNERREFELKEYYKEHPDEKMTSQEAEELIERQHKIKEQQDARDEEIRGKEHQEMVNKQQERYRYQREIMNMENKNNKDLKP